MSIYERIESLRKHKKISQGKLEKELGFSNGSVSKWKNSTPTPERLQKLAEYFGVTVDYLLGKEENEDVGSLIKDRDLKKKYLEIYDMLKSGETAPLYWDGQPADPESIDLLSKQVEFSFAIIEKSKKQEIAHAEHKKDSKNTD